MSRTKGSKNKVKEAKNILVETLDTKKGFEVLRESGLRRYDPKWNINAISILKQEDGNYIGEMQINGRLKTTRQVSPESVLQYLLYHDGDTYQ